MTQADTTYLDAIKNGDTKGLRAIYQNFLPRISNFIRSKGGSSDDAKDVFQDAIVIIYEKSKAADFQLTSGFYTLLYGICRNIWGNRLQKSSSKNELPIPEETQYRADDDTQQLLEQEEENKLFWSAFKQLGDDCQRLLKLFFTKVKMAEIVEKMQLSSVSYAKKRKFQCKEKLVQLVKADQRYAELTA